MKVDIYEMDYSVSPGGVNCWEMDVFYRLGHSANFSDFKSPGQAINHLIKHYPEEQFVINLTSLTAYHALVSSLD